MESFKFLKKNFLNSTLRGEFYFGSLRYYRSLEEEYGDDQIGDKNEGVATTRLNYTFRENEMRPQDPRRAHLEMFGFNMSGGNSELAFTNCITSRKTDAFAFSTCLDFRSGRAQFCNIESKSRYDSCIKFLDVVEISRLIYLYGRVRQMNGASSDIPLPTFASIVGESEIIYQSNIFDYDGNGLALPSPVKKLPKYAPQKEHRHYIIPQPEFANVENVIIHCPQASALLRECPID